MTNLISSTVSLAPENKSFLSNYNSQGMGALGDSPLPPANPSAKNINFALYLVLFTLHNTFDNGLFKNQKALADFLSAQGLSTGAIAALVTLMGNLEGTDPTTYPENIGTDLHAFWNSWSTIFGANATFDPSTGDVIPEKGSALDQYMQLLISQNSSPGQQPPYDPHNDALYQQFNQIAKFFNTTTVTGWMYSNGNWQQNTDPVPILQIFTNPQYFETFTFYTMVGNHWMNNHPDAGHTGNQDYLADISANGSSEMQTAQGLTQDKLAMMNQNNNEITSIYQVLQQALMKAAEAISTAVKLSLKR